MDVSLSTRRLILRPPLASDAERIALYLDNFAVAGNLSRVPYPYKLADAMTWLNQWRPDFPATRTSFAIALPDEGMIGIVGFEPHPSGTVIGYWLAQPFWNRGLMSEATACALDWYFSTTDGMVVTSGAFAFNKASLAIQKKLGFTEIGHGFKHCLARGEDLRHIDTELQRSVWAERPK